MLDGVLKWLGSSLYELTFKNELPKYLDTCQMISKLVAYVKKRITCKLD